MMKGRNVIVFEYSEGANLLGQISSIWHEVTKEGDPHGLKMAAAAK